MHEAAKAACEVVEAQAASSGRLVVAHYPYPYPDPTPTPTLTLPLPLPLTLCTARRGRVIRVTGQAGAVAASLGPRLLAWGRGC